MSSSEIIVLEDILQKDLYVYESLDDAILEIQDTLKTINRSHLHFAWMIGNFLQSEKLRTKYKATLKDVAKALGTSVNSLYNYKTVKNTITQEQLRRLGELGSSINAVLAVAVIRRENPQAGEKLLEGLLTNSVSTESDVRETYVKMIGEASKSYNLLPGGEPGESDEDESLSSDVKDAEDAATTPAEKILDAEIVSDPEHDDDDDDYEASDRGGDSPTANDVSAERAAKAMLRQARQVVTAARRDVTTIIRDLQEQYEKVIQMQDIILGSEDCSTQFDDMMQAAYQEMGEAVNVLSKQLVKGVREGYVYDRIPLHKEVLEAFDGAGLFRQEE